MFRNRKIFVLFTALSVGTAVFFAFQIKKPALASVQDDIAAKQAQIDQIQQQIDEYQQQIDASHSQSTTLQSEISALNAQISQIQLEIKSLNVSINKTGLEITDTQNQIADSEDKLEKHKNALAQYIKIINENDKKTLTEILLANQNLSDFFNQLNNINITQDNLKASIDSIKQLKADLESQESDLENKQTQLQQAKNMQVVEQGSLSQNKTQKNKILQVTKGEESKYQELVKQSQKNIDALRGEITYLEQNGISVEDATKYGQMAATALGIRPAFLLAELNQESGLGMNVGKCTIVDTSSGQTRKITTGQIFQKGINPARDLALFLGIVSELSKDPFQTTISCPQSSGWGGAMGPAQFIPSTWMGYRDQVSTLTGHHPADPWSIEDSFMASAIKLAKDGASSKTKAGEIAASKRYYCGSATSTSASCINYANSVQRLATQIEANL